MAQRRAAWLMWGTRRAERCFCLSEAKGKNREPRAEGKFRQEFYRKPSQVVPPAQKFFFEK